MRQERGGRMAGSGISGGRSSRFPDGVKRRHSEVGGINRFHSGFCFDVMDVGIRNFPTKVFASTALFQMLL